VGYYFEYLNYFLNLLSNLFGEMSLQNKI